MAKRTRDHAHDQQDAHTEAAPQPEEGSQSSGDLVAEIQKLTEERNELRDQLLRTVADMQNTRKRLLQEAQQTRQFATEELVRELLPVLDNFERTIAVAEGGATLATVLEGVKAVDRQLRTALERRNVTRITTEGASFDPDVHEAIAADEAHELPEGTITAEIEAGYKMAERVIRPARVRVSKKP